MEKLPESLFDVHRLSEHVRVLSSDEFEGRAPASDGEQKTLAYLTEQFARLGLQPGGDAGTWTQAVTLRRIELVHAGGLRVTANGRTQEFRHGEEAVYASFAGLSEVLIAEAPLVFVGYGISAPERDWDDFKGADLKGKVAIVLVNDPDFESPTPGRFGGQSMTYYGRWTYKFEEAARRGAAGVLIAHEDAAASYGWTTVRNGWPSVQFDLQHEDARAAHTLIRGWVRRDIAVQLFRQANLDFEASKKDAQRSDFKPVTLSGVTCSVQLKAQVTPAITHNVLARVPGCKRPRESVIYGAHWDHFGIGKPDAHGDRIYHGAVDNATAIAGLLELARVSASGPAPERSIYFVAFAAEEKGLLGSEHYVRHPLVALEQTAAVFNMELMGMAGPARDLATWGHAKSTLLKVLSEAARAHGRYVSPDPQPEAGYQYRSDHFPFARCGVPAITVSTGQDLYEGGQAAGQQVYRNYITHRYHQPADRWSPEMDLRGLALDLDVLYRAGRTIADSTEWPQWLPGAEFQSARTSNSPA